MAYAPVIAFDRARRVAMARQLQRLGVPLATITATTGDTELADLWLRERTIASLRRLTGHPRALLDLYHTSELQELERCTLRNLMDADRRTGADQLIYSIGGRQPHGRTALRRQHLRAWNIPA